MVSALLADALSSPTDALIQLYRDSSDPNTLADFPNVVSKHFSSVFATQDAFRQIPPLDVNHPFESHGNQSLVRFRAMVQDTSPSPEMYLSTLSTNRCGGWGLAQNTDSNHNDGHLDYEKLGERTVLWAVNIPGEAPWCSRDLDDTQTVPCSSPESLELAQPKAYKFPIPDQRHVSAQIKIYDASAESLRPTDIITFVGILTSEPEHSEFVSETPVPILHVLFYLPMPKTIVHYPYPFEAYEPSTRDQLISWLATEALGNDTDAAEWVILCCIACVQSRNPSLLQPSLTLSHFPQPTRPHDVPVLSYVLSEILPLVSLLPFTLDILNNQDFAPESKNEDLHSGILQLPKGTVIIVTESGIQEGNIVEKGVRNIQALQEVIKFQQLHYRFPFSQFAFPTDLNFVVLSEGGGSAFCETSVVIPLQPSLSSDLYKPKDAVKLPSQEMLAPFRQLIVASKCGKVNIGEDVSQHIQADFVKERQLDRSVSPDDLIHRMTIARLIALSSHEREITQDVWARTKVLDARRKARGS